MNPMILQTSMQGEEVQEIITQRLIPAVVGMDRSKTMMALLTFFVVLSKPDLEPELLQKTVKGASEYVVLALTEVELQNEAPKGMAN